MDTPRTISNVDDCNYINPAHLCLDDDGNTYANTNSRVRARSTKKGEQELGFQHLVYFDNDIFTGKHRPVVRFNQQWYSLHFEKNTLRPFALHPRPEVAVFDEEDSEHDSDRASDINEPEEDFRTSPASVLARYQDMTTTVIAARTTTETQQRPNTPPNIAELLPPAEQLYDALQRALRRTPGGSGPGGPGGNPSNPGGPGGPGGPGAGGVGGAQAQPAPAGDIRTMGQLPSVFTGDRAQAEDFIEHVKGYLCLNRGINGLDSAIRKIILTLTLIEGPQVVGWK